MTQRTARMLSALDSQAQSDFKAFFELLDNSIGEDRYIFFEGLRKQSVQKAYYAQGREPLEAVNTLRKEAGLYLLRSEKDNYVITWTLKSKHLDGFAGDVLPVDGAGNPTWDLAHYYEVFTKIRACGKEAGLVCGADWNPPDWPHYELRV